MARVNPRRVKSLQYQQDANLFDSGMYRNYERENTPMNQSLGGNQSHSQQVKVRKEEGLFYKLRRLMYGPNIIPDLDKYASGKLSQGQQRKIKRYQEFFQRIQSTVNGGITRNDGDRRLRMMEYDRMEGLTPEVGRALDVIASDATTPNQDGDVVTVTCENEKIKEEVEYLFTEILSLNSNAFQGIRDMAKYGDSFFMNHIDAKDGIKKLVAIPTNHVEREVGFEDRNPFAYRYKIEGMTNETLEPYEVTHFRIKSSVEFDEYGRSVLESGRRIWRQLITIEDSMIIYRLVRAPQRRVFYFDAGNIKSADVEGAVKKFANAFKKDRIYDTDGNLDYRLSLASVEEDFFIPTRSGSDGNRIETLDSLEGTSIDDVEYIHQKFITSLGVPNSFLGYEEALSNKSSLGQEDIRYARFVERIQQAFLEGLYNLVLIHLYTKGYKTFDISEITLELTNPSHINELQELEIFQARLNAERDAKADKSFSNYGIKKNIGKMTDQEIEEEEHQLLRDGIRNFTFAQAEAGVLLTVKDVLDYNTAEAQAAKDAMAGGGGGGDLGGGGMGGGLPMGDDLGGGFDGDGFDEFDTSEPPMGDAGLSDMEAPDTLEEPQGLEDINQDAEENQNQ